MRVAVQVSPASLVTIVLNLPECDDDYGEGGDCFCLSSLGYLHLICVADETGKGWIV